MAVIAAVAFVAFVGEKFSERTIKLLIKALSAQFNGVANQHLADLLEAVACAIPGFVISLLAGLDLFPAIGLPLAGSSGLIITALGAGFGSNLVHDIVSAIPDGETINWMLYEAGRVFARENRESDGE